jgi:hypothetical protein
MKRNLEEAAKRNGGNTVVLTRLFNEVQAQKMLSGMKTLDVKCTYLHMT